MKPVFLFVCLTVALLTLASHAHAGFEAIVSGGGHVTLTLEQFKKIEAGSTPACVKNGGSFKEANDAYRAKFGKNKSFCSESPKARYMARTLADTEVIVVKVSSLPKDLMMKYLAK